MPEAPTDRDRQYLRAVFALKGAQRPVGPQELARAMGVTKVCAFQKMRRLEALGLGDYHIRRGLVLNTAGTGLVEEEIRRHHLLERFLSRTLNMSREEACDHSDHMGPFICREVLEGIAGAMDGDLECECGHCIHDCGDHTGSEDCHWLKRNG